MVFSSPLFLFLFLPVALGAYHAVGRWGLGARNAVLTVLSYGFYAWANPAFTLLMLGSTAVDYACGRAMVRGVPSDGDGLPQLGPGDRTAGQRAALWVSITTNLGLLATFKYAGFAAGNWQTLAALTGLPALPPDWVLDVVLPVGISFYTFQSMSYTIDVYRGHARPIRRFTDFACYVAMFPQLVAGPIIRFTEVARQLADRTHTLDKAARGVAFFVLGLAKKVLLANPCGAIADTVFDASAVHPTEAWWGTLAHAFQIYFDFSGYSDMAIGLGLLLGFTFPRNFDAPYRATSITDFWRRWHISLSSWLRDYLYIPLGGNRASGRRTYVNLALVMLFGGLWHGAAWTFVIWGGLHGLLLGLERARGKTSPWSRLPRPVQVAATFGLVCLTWVFFRADSLGAALAHLASMFGARAPHTADVVAATVYGPADVLAMGAAAAVVWGAPQTWDVTQRLGVGKAVGVFGLFVVAVGVLLTQAYNPFIYFQF